MTKTTEVGKVQDKLNKVQSEGLKKAEALAIEFMAKNKEEGKIATNDQIYQCLSKVGKWPTQSRPNISSKPVTGMCLGLVYVFIFCVFERSYFENSLILLDNENQEIGR